MKKLLFKMFPKFFTVNITEEKIINVNQLDTSNLPDGTNKFKVFHVEPDNENMHEGLGISEEKVSFYSKKVKMSILESKNTIDAMALLAPHIKHANEFYLVSIMLYVEVQRMQGGNGGPGGLLAALLAGLGPNKD
jgi:hypothetical protein